VNALEMTESVDFTAIKQSVSMEQVLDRYGLTAHLRRTSGGYRGPCPIHGGHNPTQFSVSTSKNVWVCFGDCGTGGGVIDFVRCMEQVTLHEAALLLHQWFDPGTGTCRLPNKGARRTIQPQNEVRNEQPNEPLPFTLSELDSTHPYLASRGFLPATVAAFGVGSCTKGLMAGRIAIPIHNATEIVAYAGRSPEPPHDDQPKYLFPRGFRKSLELFNCHRALVAEPRTALVVVEGFFGCMSVWQAGFPRVVAIMGSSLSDAQEDLIVGAVQPRGTVLLMFDEDGAGRVGREKAAARLSRRIDVKVIELEIEGIQPDHLPACEILAMVRDSGCPVSV
jgi:DNA primase